MITNAGGEAGQVLVLTKPLGTGLRANRQAFESLVEYRGDLGEPRRSLLYDPQTSGGLLLLVPEAKAEVLVREVDGARAIGKAVPLTQKPLIVRG